MKTGKLILGFIISMTIICIIACNKKNSDSLNVSNLSSNESKKSNEAELPESKKHNFLPRESFFGHWIYNDSLDYRSSITISEDKIAFEYTRYDQNGNEIKRYNEVSPINWKAVSNTLGPGYKITGTYSMGDQIGKSYGHESAFYILEFNGQMIIVNDGTEEFAGTYSKD